MDGADQIARMIGERIRSARHAKAMTLGALSKAAGLSTPFLSRLERGETSTSIANLIHIATGLGIQLYSLFESARPAPVPPQYVLVRREARGSMPMLSAAGYTYERLGGDLNSHRLDAFELEFPVGGSKKMLLVAHEGEEVLFLLSGKIEFQVGRDRFLMKEGDCVHFNSEQPHMGRNAGKKPARMLMVVSPSRPVGNQFGWLDATAATGRPKPASDGVDLTAITSRFAGQASGRLKNGGRR
jgi:transcriptional regulator with XRE-family HTH domain